MHTVGCCEKHEIRFDKNRCDICELQRQFAEARAIIENFTGRELRNAAAEKWLENNKGTLGGTQN